MSAGTDTPETLGLFVTCLVDLYRPRVGFAAVRLLEALGYRVEAPLRQVCCGQPAYNSGDRSAAAHLARQTVAELEGYDRVVVPSGSCAAMLSVEFPRLLDDDPGWAERARSLAARTWELTAFLDSHEALPELPAYRARVCHHDACTGLRELGIDAAPRRLLARVPGLELRPLREPRVCCGFGGTFCVKYGPISERMVADKTADIAASGADVVTGGDLGCLLNIAGRLRREGAGQRCRHIAEVLAGDTEGPALAEPEGRGSNG